MAEENGGISEFFEKHEDDDDVTIIGEGKEEGEGEGKDKDTDLKTDGDKDTTDTDVTDATTDQDVSADKDADDSSGDDKDVKTDNAKDDKTDIDSRDTEIASLRQLVKEQGVALDNSKDRFKQLEEKLVDEGTLNKGDLDPASDIDEITAIKEKLIILEETVKMNPKYEDYDNVVSDKHYNSTVEVMAKLVQSEDGGTLSERIKDVEVYIWNLANPFKYLYDTIKNNHPAFKTDSDDADKDSGKDKKNKKVIAPSLSNLDGGGSNKGGWTAAKIDALEEEDLSTVPTEIYAKYMQGDLA